MQRPAWQGVSAAVADACVAAGLDLVQPFAVHWYNDAVAAPNQLAAGMDYVLVNGVPVVAAGKATGARPGKVLRGAGVK